MTTNTKAVWSALLGIAFGFVGYMAWHDTGAPATTQVPSETASSTESAAASEEVPTAQGTSDSAAEQPTITPSGKTKKVVHQELAFSAATTTTTSTYPTLTGTASNVDSAQMVIFDADDVGLISSTVEVKDGSWSYTVSRALKPGTYTAVLAIPGLLVKSALIVTEG